MIRYMISMGYYGDGEDNHDEEEFEEEFKRGSTPRPSAPTSPVAAAPITPQAPSTVPGSNDVAKSTGLTPGDLEMGGIAPADPKVAVSTPVKPIEDAKQSVKSVVTPAKDLIKSPAADSKQSEKSTEWVPPSVKEAQ